MKELKAEDYINIVFKMYFETEDWKNLEKYAQQFKEMYFKELNFLRKQNKTLDEKALADLAILNVNNSYDKIINDLGNFINELSLPKE